MILIQTCHWCAAADYELSRILQVMLNCWKLKYRPGGGIYIKKNQELLQTLTYFFPPESQFTSILTIVCSFLFCAFCWEKRGWSLFLSVKSALYLWHFSLNLTYIHREFALWFLNV